MVKSRGRGNNGHKQSLQGFMYLAILVSESLRNIVSIRNGTQLGLWCALEIRHWDNC